MVNGRSGPLSVQAGVYSLLEVLSSGDTLRIEWLTYVLC